MINIRVLSLLSFTPLLAHDVELRFPNFSHDTIEYIKTVAKGYPGKSIKIEVIPETTFFEKIKNTITSSDNFNKRGQGDSFLSKDTLFFLLKGCFGASTVSYISIAYIIYRAYTIAKKINAWFVVENEDQDNPMNDIERMLFKNKSLKISDLDEKWISYYITLNTYLKKKGVRNYFFKNNRYDDLLLRYATYRRTKPLNQ